MERFGPPHFQLNSFGVFSPWVRVVAYGYLFSLFVLHDAPQAHGIFVRELLRYDGSTNIVLGRVQGGVWVWDNLQGRYVPGSVPSFSHRLPAELFVAVFEAVSVNGVADFEGELTGYLAIHLATGQTFWDRGGRGFWQRVAAIYGFDGIGNRDPFGRLSGEVALSIFVDRQKDFPSSSSGLEEYVRSATNGEFFGSFGFGRAIDEQMGGASGRAVAQANWTILEANLLRLMAGLNVAAVTPCLESYPFPGLPNAINGEINSARLQATFTPALGGPWPWEGTVLLEFRITPEPTSLALLLSLAVGGIAARLRWLPHRPHLFAGVS